MVFVAMAAVLLALDALATREALVAARTELDAARTALGEGDTASAEAHVGAASAAIERARSRTDGPLWAAARRIPVLGRTPEVTARVVDVAAVATRFSGHAVERGAPFLDEGLQIQVTDGRVDLRTVHAANALLAGLPTDRLADAAEELRATDDTWIPGPVRDGRRDALDLADQVIDLAGDGRALTGLLPRLLGEDEPREFLLAVQTSAELRGTGGLIGFLSVLRIDDGHFELSPPAVYEALDQATEKATLPGDPLAPNLGGTHDPVPVPDDFHRRYEHVNAAGHLSNVNVDPDLPTTGPVLADIYEDRTGRDVDGVLLLDTVGMQQLMLAIGDVPIPEPARVHPEIPASIPADEIAEWTTVRVYDLIGQEHSADRETFLKAFGISAFQQVFGGSWDGIAVGQAVADAAASRHLQLYSRDAAEQAALDRLGVSGAMVPADGHDLLAVTANNAVGGKMDVHVAHRIEGEIDLALTGSTVARRTARLRTTLQNPLPASGRDLYIIGNCLVGGASNGCFHGPPGMNRSWFSVWAPPHNAIDGGVSGDGSPMLRFEAIGDRRVADHYLETGPQSENWFQVEVDGEVPIRRDGPDLVYGLTWWRQAKAIPDHLDLTIAAPDGWQVAEVTIEGGGEPTGMGMAGTGEPVAATVRDDATGVRITGAVTRDVHVTLRLSRGLTERMWDWLSTPVGAGAQ